MRIAGRFTDQHQLGSAVDSLKKLGLSRKDMIISDLAKEPMTNKQRLRDVWFRVNGTAFAWRKTAALLKDLRD